MRRITSRSSCTPEANEWRAHREPVSSPRRSTRSCGGDYRSPEQVPASATAIGRIAERDGVDRRTAAAHARALVVRISAGKAGDLMEDTPPNPPGDTRRSWPRPHGPAPARGAADGRRAAGHVGRRARRAPRRGPKERVRRSRVSTSASWGAEWRSCTPSGRRGSLSSRCRAAWRPSASSSCRVLRRLRGPARAASGAATALRAGPGGATVGRLRRARRRRPRAA